MASWSCINIADVKPPPYKPLVETVGGSLEEAENTFSAKSFSEISENTFRQWIKPALKSLHT